MPKVILWGRDSIIIDVNNRPTKLLTPKSANAAQSIISRTCVGIPDGAAEPIKNKRSLKQLAKFKLGHSLLLLKQKLSGVDVRQRQWRWQKDTEINGRHPWGWYQVTISASRTLPFSLLFPDDKSQLLDFSNHKPVVGLDRPQISFALPFPIPKSLLVAHLKSDYHTSALQLILVLPLTTAHHPWHWVQGLWLTSRGSLSSLLTPDPVSPRALVGSLSSPIFHTLPTRPLPLLSQAPAQPSPETHFSLKMNVLHSVTLGTWSPVYFHRF